MSRLTIGLTGGIASGKTLVGEQFAALGVPVLDADQVSRDVVKPPSAALDRIAESFGRQFIDASGQLDRRRLRAEVFADSSKRQQLEAILHPLIAQRLQDWRDAQTTPYCILSVAILLESGMHRLVDRILVVDVSEALQISRLVMRDGIDETLARSMLGAQAARSERLRRADDVIQNDGDPGSCREQVAHLHRRYLELAAAKAGSQAGLK